MVNDSKRSSYTISLFIVIITYAVAISIAVFTGRMIKVAHPVWIVAVTDVIATVVVFAFSYSFNNSSLYDPYWSVIPVPISYYFHLVNPEGDQTRHWLIIVLIGIWSIRLTSNWLRGWKGLHHQDWRYDDLAKKHGKAYWLVSFGGIHLFPTFLVFLACLPVYFAMKVNSPLGIIDYLAAIVTLIAISIEAISDEQMKIFKQRAAGEKSKLNNLGLWAYSRHPNYFGEILFWIGLYIFVFNLQSIPYWWTGIGALSMICLFIFISIPMMDERSLKMRPGYEEEIRKKSSLFPWFKKL